MFRILKYLFPHRSIEAGNKVITCASGTTGESSVSDNERQIPDALAAKFIDDPDPYGRDWQWLREPEDEAPRGNKAKKSSNGQ